MIGFTTTFASLRQDGGCGVLLGGVNVLLQHVPSRGRTRGKAVLVTAVGGSMRRPRSSHHDLRVPADKGNEALTYGSGGIDARGGVEPCLAPPYPQ